MEQPTAHSVLKQYFGYDTFRGPQEAIITDVLAGKDVLVLMPTGGGKSLCYQVPALLRHGVAIVVSPLISLMEDQVAALKLQGIRAAYYNSSLNSEQSRQVLAQLHNNQLDLLYIAPERLLSQTFLDRLLECDLALFAIDEAHCISQWGHDFRPEYAELGLLKQHFPEVPLIALTATADKQTRLDIIKKLNYKPEIYIASFNRPNIHYRVIPKNNPLRQLGKLLETQRGQAGIIYCGTRAGVDTLTTKLQENGFAVRGYHAGLPYAERREVQTLFRYDQIDLVVATIAFGMGIDKPNVRFVLHYDLPKTIESYYQETGRAGRDGLPAQAVLFYDPADIFRLKSWITALESETQRFIEQNKLNHMIAFAEASHCRRQILLRYFDEHDETDCHYCDICDNPPQVLDATQDAQKFLSCIYRLNQRYGLTHTIDVLRGSSDAKIIQAKHHELSTYGIGQNKSIAYWKQLAWQLIHQDYCFMDISQYNVLKLTGKSKLILKGEQNVAMAITTIKPDKTKEAKKKKAAVATSSSGLKNNPIFELLRRLRRQIAEEESRPPFMIFSDNTLLELAHEKPQELDDMAKIPGIGEHKLARYGLRFLKLLRKEKDQVE